jgi:class 3 adenylate cyclase/predicted ATPase
MDFYAVLERVLELLQQHKRVTYRALQRQFGLDEAYLEDLKAEIIEARQLAVDEGGRVLVWTGAAGMAPVSAVSLPQAVSQPAAPEDSHARAAPAPTLGGASEAERRQLTVLFCDLVDSTTLARQLDPEDYREVVRAYQATCAAVIQRFDGYIAQYLGDGLLVYFGYPQAHEDDAQRAVRAGLEMLGALAALQPRLAADKGIRLAVRLGMHTGLVVVGAMGTGGRQEALALGDTPNIAARLQGLAAPDTVVVSDATWRLVQGYFACDALGPQLLKGVGTPVPAYRVLGPSGAQSRLDAASSRGLTPLVGREAEVALLRERWAQARDGLGQIVLLSGEAGIGKSRLVMALKQHVAGEPHTAWECRCSPYFQDSALYPLIDLSQRALQFGRDEAPEAKLQKIAAALGHYGLAQPETVALWATLLSVPLAEPYPPLHLTPQRQKQKTLEAMVALLLAMAAEQPVLFIVEDVHWIDASTLEFLSLCIDQGPTARLLILLTCRPEFHAPWGFRAHLTPLTLNRLPRPQVLRLIGRVAGGKALPSEVVEQIVAKTDGVPLFVEELTKMVLESALLREGEGHYELAGPLPSLAIPATLHDSLMARLDRLTPVKAVAQLGATIGRTFAYELLQAVSPLDEATLQHGLRQLVDAELVYQRGVPPQATYTFKHALIQDAAYQSLLRSTRQQYHQRLAQVLEARFPETIETQPELVAHHYTEAGLGVQALDYWQRAGQRALERSAHVEAISHLTKGLEVLKTLPNTPERTQQELGLQLTLGIPLSATRGYATPEVAHIYTRARELCQGMGEGPDGPAPTQSRQTPQLIPVLLGLWRFYLLRAELTKAREVAEQCLLLVQRVNDPARLIVAHDALGETLFFLGDFAQARTHLEQAVALYDPQRRRSHRALTDPGVASLSILAGTLWMLGYSDQALQRTTEALHLAEAIPHPHILASALVIAAHCHQYRRERQTVRERAEAVMALATEHGFPFWLAEATIFVGWAQAEQGRGSEGIAQIHHGLATRQAIGLELSQSAYIIMLAEAYANVGQPAEGLAMLADALTRIETTGERWRAAELHRLRGGLLLALSTANHGEAETCFQQARALARHQQAKSLELRAAMSLARLWQQQGKRAEAHQLLAEIYGWFTEGFDTADLQEAKVLLEKLAW